MLRGCQFFEWAECDDFLQGEFFMSRAYRGAIVSPGVAFGVTYGDLDS